MIEDGWIRQEFPVKKQCIYCNNAAVAPLPASTSGLLQEWLNEYTLQGSVNYPQWLKAIEQCRHDFARFINCIPSEIAFVKNTSAGLSTLANGYPFQEGDEVIVFEHEFPSNLYPWLSLERKGVKVKVVPERNYQYDYEEWRSLITSRTRLCSVSFIEYSTGFRHDLEFLGKECRKRGIIFAVDAIQGLGVFPLDVRRYGIDFLCADGHKWLLAPEGCAVMYMKQSLIPQIQPITLGWHSVKHHSNYDLIKLDLKEDAGRFEEGSPNVFGILALKNSLALIRRCGLSNIAERVSNLTGWLKENVSGKKYECISTGNHPSCIAAFQPLNRNPHEILSRLKQENIFAAMRRNSIRFSPHFYNDPDEMKIIADIMNSV